MRNLHNKTIYLYTNTSKYTWSTILTQEYTTVIDGKTVTHHYSITYVIGLFQGSQLNWDTLTKELYTIYMAVRSYLSIWQILVSLYEVAIY